MLVSGDEGSDDSDDEGSDDGDSHVSEYYSCPATFPGSSSECTANCLLHSECNDSPTTKCCYNGCGYSCMHPHRIPFIDLSSAHPTECPDEGDVPCLETVGSCQEEEFACEEGVEMCCDNSCGISVCISTELDTPCFTAAKIAQTSNTSDLMGSYRPQCTSRGLFREIQCHAHFCWCVVSDSGVPLSDIVPFEQANVLACAGG